MNLKHSSLCVSTLLIIIELLGCSEDDNKEDGTSNYKWCQLKSKGSNICYQIGKKHKDFDNEELSKDECTARSGSLIENRPEGCLDKTPKWCLLHYDKLKVGETPTCYEIGAKIEGTDDEFTELDCMSKDREEIDEDNIPQNCEVKTE
jgi:hypothetical protein